MGSEMCIRDRVGGAFGLVLLRQEVVNRSKRLTARIKALLVINIHGVDKPFFDLLKIQFGERAWNVGDELKTEFRICADNHIEPVQYECLLCRIAKRKLLCRSGRIASRRQYGIKHLIEALLDEIGRQLGFRGLHGGRCV